MKNYIITNKTVALLKNKNKTIIINKNDNITINKNIISIINNNCLFYGNTLNGRKKAVEKLVNSKYKIPIIINKDIILLQLNNLRKDYCLFLILNKILNYKEINNKILIKCVNNIVFLDNISIYSFEKLIVNGLIINNYLKSQKY